MKLTLPCRLLLTVLALTPSIGAAKSGARVKKKLPAPDAAKTPAADAASRSAQIEAAIRKFDQCAFITKGLAENPALKETLGAKAAAWAEDAAPLPDGWRLRRIGDALVVLPKADATWDAPQGDGDAPAAPLLGLMGAALQSQRPAAAQPRKTAKTTKEKSPSSKPAAASKQVEAAGAAFAAAMLSALLPPTLSSGKETLTYGGGGQLDDLIDMTAFLPGYLSLLDKKTRATKAGAASALKSLSRPSDALAEAFATSLDAGCARKPVTKASLHDAQLKTFKALALGAATEVLRLEQKDDRSARRLLTRDADGRFTATIAIAKPRGDDKKSAEQALFAGGGTDKWTFSTPDRQRAETFYTAAAATLLAPPKDVEALPSPQLARRLATHLAAVKSGKTPAAGVSTQCTGQEPHKECLITTATNGYLLPDEHVEANLRARCKQGKTARDEACQALQSAAEQYPSRFDRNEIDLLVCEHGDEWACRNIVAALGKADQPVTAKADEWKRACAGGAVDAECADAAEKAKAAGNDALATAIAGAACAHGRYASRSCAAVFKLKPDADTILSYASVDVAADGEAATVSGMPGGSEQLPQEQWKSISDALVARCDAAKPEERGRTCFIAAEATQEHRDAAAVTDRLRAAACSAKLWAACDPLISSCPKGEAARCAEVATALAAACGEKNAAACARQAQLAHNAGKIAEADAGFAAVCPAKSEGRNRAYCSVLLRDLVTTKQDAAAAALAKATCATDAHNCQLMLEVAPDVAWALALSRALCAPLAAGKKSDDYNLGFECTAHPRRLWLAGERPLAVRVAQAICKDGHCRGVFSATSGTAATELAVALCAKDRTSEIEQACTEFAVRARDADRAAAAKIAKSLCARPGSDGCVPMVAEGLLPPTEALVRAACTGLPKKGKETLGSRRNTRACGNSVRRLANAGKLAAARVVVKATCERTPDACDAIKGFLPNAAPAVVVTESAPAAAAQAAAPTIYFAFDDDTLNADARTKLRALADGMKENKGMVIQVEGHCDERGSIEYNLDLGERRARVAKNYLAERGVAGKRVRTISYGEDKPAAEGHDEKAWAKNRRDEFTISKAY